jgi:hypothetical protein
MSKLTSIIYVVFLLAIICLGAEEIPFEEYRSLNPEIDLLPDIDTGNIGRKLLLFPQLASFIRTEYAYIYDVSRNSAVKMPSEEAGLFPYTRIYPFWDPHTKTNYGYVRPLTENNINGWYMFTLGDDDRLALSLQSRDEYWACRSPPCSRISDSKILASRYSGYIRNRSPEHKYDSDFYIIDIDKKEKIWTYSVTHDTSVDLYWISGSWLFSFLTPRIAGIWKTDTILNYETNAEVSFAPESIIGYGDGVILTSLQTERDFIGITIWNTEKEILYCDKDFVLTGMLEGLRKYFPGQPTIDFSYYDFPYIYCNISDVVFARGGYTMLVMNLKEKKTYMAPAGYSLQCIFEAD